MDVGSKDIAEHSFTVYESDHNATCIADGTKTSVCDLCSAEDTVVDVGSKDIAEHSFTVYESDNNATCIADGTKTSICDLCSVEDTVTDVGSKEKATHNYVGGRCFECHTIDPEIEKEVDNNIVSPNLGDIKLSIILVGIIMQMSFVGAVIFLKKGKKVVALH